MNSEKVSCLLLLLLLQVEARLHSSFGPDPSHRAIASNFSWGSRQLLGQWRIGCTTMQLRSFPLYSSLLTLKPNLPGQQHTMRRDNDDRTRQTRHTEPKDHDLPKMENHMHQIFTCFLMAGAMFSFLSFRTILSACKKGKGKKELTFFPPKMEVSRIRVVEKRRGKKKKFPMHKVSSQITSLFA